MTLGAEGLARAGSGLGGVGNQPAGVMRWWLPSTSWERGAVSRVAQEYLRGAFHSDPPLIPRGRQVREEAGSSSVTGSGLGCSSRKWKPGQTQPGFLSPLPPPSAGGVGVGGSSRNSFRLGAGSGQAPTASTWMIHVPRPFRTRRVPIRHPFAGLAHCRPCINAHQVIRAGYAVLLGACLGISNHITL